VLTIITITPTPLRASVLFYLRVSPKAIAPAFKSLHLLLPLNTEAEEKRRHGEVWEDIGERGYSPLRADSMTV
jgi:hypothetical protein